MTKIEILNQYKKQKKNTYRESDVINAMEKYLESYKQDQALQLQQTGVIRRSEQLKCFFCKSEDVVSVFETACFCAKCIDKQETF